MDEKNTFWFYFQGKEEIEKGLKLRVISKILSNFNKLFLSVADSRKYIDEENFKKETFEPSLFPKIRKGSIYIGAKLKPPVSYDFTLFGDPYQKTNDEVKNLIQKFDREEDYEYFKNTFPNDKERVTLLNIAKNLNFFYGPNYTILYVGKDGDFNNPEFQTDFNQEKRIRIRKWIEEKEQISEIPHMDGIYIGFKTPANVFWIINKEGKEINCRFEDDFEGFPSRKGEFYRVYGEYSEIPGIKPEISDVIKVEWIGAEKIFKNLKIKYIKEIEKILKLEKGWDLPDSDIYKPETIRNGLFYLSKIIQLLREKYKKELPYPMLFPGGSGGIELEWSEENFDLQISIPIDIKELSGIYGVNKKDKDDEIIIDFKLFEVREDLIEWLSRIL